MPDAASDLYHLFGFAYTNISPSLLTGDFQLSYCTYAFYCWVVDSRYAQKKRADKLFVIVCKLFFNGTLTRDREVVRIITLEGHLGTNEAKNVEERLALQVMVFKESFDMNCFDFWTVNCKLPPPPGPAPLANPLHWVYKLFCKIRYPGHSLALWQY